MGNTRLLSCCQNPTVSNQQFSDDDFIQEQKVINIDTEGFGQLILKSQFQKIQPIKSRVYAGLCSLRVSSNIRSSIDLICIIDISASMFGEKIALAKKSMKYIVDLLKEKDRLSIILYNERAVRVCSLLKAVDNKQKLKEMIDKIEVRGLTLMYGGLLLALKQLTQRKYRNNVSSIFVLSDGEEQSNTAAQFKNSLAYQPNRIAGQFSIHSFGFGNDYNEKIMKDLCSLKDGNLYFIEELDSLDQCFCNAFGSAITQAASNIQISVQSISESIKIHKVLGNKWEKKSDNRYTIKLNQIVSDVSKQFAFELITNDKIQSLENSLQKVLRVTFRGRKNNGKLIKDEQILQINVVSSLDQIRSDYLVIQPYLRMKATEVIDEAILMCNQRRYSQAKKIIENIIETILYHPFIRKDKIKSLLEDLERAKKNCEAGVFQYQGIKHMESFKYCHANNNNFQYSNSIQKNMLLELQNMKQFKKY